MDFPTHLNSGNIEKLFFRLAPLNNDPFEGGKEVKQYLIAFTALAVPNKNGDVTVIKLQDNSLLGLNCI